MSLSVNGIERQRGNTGQMIFNCFELVEWITRIVTLEPGDVISTGTPAGVGAAAGTSLEDGDVIEATIERLGDPAQSGARLIGKVVSGRGAAGPALVLFKRACENAVRRGALRQAQKTQSTTRGKSGSSRAQDARDRNTVRIRRS